MFRRTFIITIDNDKLMVVRRTAHGEAATGIYNLEQLTQYFDAEAINAGCAVQDLRILASSKLDFPTEHTKNAAVIKMAQALRIGKLDQSPRIKV